MENQNFICIDRIVPYSYSPARTNAKRAIKAAGGDFAHMALVRLNMWENGTTLNCRFLGGSPTQRKRVESFAHQWEEFANIKFRFIEAGDAQIRIAFIPNGGSWSAVGNEALIEKYFPHYQPTMNFGWLNDDTEDEEYSRVVLHEFGHALGCIHEHQQPHSPLQWNEQAVYEYFSGYPNFWSPEEIKHNIFDRYSVTETNSTEFDRNSIMLYGFPASFFINWQGTPNNTVLSETDKKYIAEMYPKH